MMKAVFVDMDEMLQEYTIPTKSDMRALVKVGVCVVWARCLMRATKLSPRAPAVGGWPTHQPGDHILKFFGALRITPNSYEAFAGAVKEISGLIEASYVWGLERGRGRERLPTRLAPAHLIFARLLPPPERSSQATALSAMGDRVRLVFSPRCLSQLHLFRVVIHEPDNERSKGKRHAAGAGARSYVHASDIVCVRARAEVGGLSLWVWLVGGTGPTLALVRGQRRQRVARHSAFGASSPALPLPTC